MEGLGGGRYWGGVGSHIEICECRVWGGPGALARGAMGLQPCGQG